MIIHTLLLYGTYGSMDRWCRSVSKVREKREKRKDQSGNINTVFSFSFRKTTQPNNKSSRRVSREIRMLAYLLYISFYHLSIRMMVPLHVPSYMLEYVHGDFCYASYISVFYNMPSGSPGDFRF